MTSLFDAAAREEIRSRLARLEPASPRQWGKMNAAQMLTHCALALEMATGDSPRPQKLIGKLLSPLVKKSVLGEKPFGRNSPTDPAFVVTDERDFEREKARLAAVIDRFCGLGPDAASGRVHSFFGRMTGDEWGTMMYKHLDHHLRQFSA